MNTNKTKRKTTIQTLAALLMAVAGTTACSSEDDIAVDTLPQKPAEQTYTMTVEASKGSDATTRALSLDGTTLNATWAEGDVVEIWSSDGSTANFGELTAQSAGQTTTLTGTLTGIMPIVNSSLLLKYRSNDYSSQTGTLDYIAQNCDYATARVKVTSVSGSEITTTAASFENQQAIVKFTLKDSDGTAISAWKLTVSDGTNTYTVTPASDTSELFVAIPGISSKTLTLTANAGSATYTYEKSDVTFTNGQYYAVTVRMTEKSDFLSGVFSVSSTKKVKFSKGNLRYASDTWSFFDNQWDYYTTYSADSWDKFGWSTSATTYGMNTSTNYITYYGDFVDWGATMGTGWFTLSSAEWTYLFNTRSASTVGSTADGRYAKANVNNVQGVILFPDTYTHPDGVTAPTGVNATDDTGWEGNSYTVADWTKMESAGCVFLPAAGYRYGSPVYGPGEYGYYWSATPDGTGYAFGVSFYPGKLNPAGSSNCFRGYSVRLVQEVAAPEEATPALSITSPSVGQVIGSDGKNYAYGSLPTGVTAVAKICYVSGSNGLALALADEESKMSWSTAIETCAAHTVPFTGGTWKLASQAEWNSMISAAGSYTALRDGFSSVGGTNLQSGWYWSSTEDVSYDALNYHFGDGNWDYGGKDDDDYVRACLEF